MTSIWSTWDDFEPTHVIRCGEIETKVRAKYHIGHEKEWLDKNTCELKHSGGARIREIEYHTEHTWCPYENRCDDPFAYWHDGEMWTFNPIFGEILIPKES